MDVHGTRRLGRAAVLAACLSLVLAACAGDDAPETGPDAQASDDSPEVASEAGDDADAADADAAADDGARLAVVATTSILGDIAQNLVGDDGDVTVLMAPGVDPHGYQPSAADAALLREADLVIANGLLLEESLGAALEAAAEDGARVLELAEHLDPIEFDGGDPGQAHDDEDDHGHGDEDDHAHDDEDGHGHDDEDGHGHDDDDGHGHEDDDDHGHEDDDGNGHDDADDHAHGPEDPHVWFDPIRMIDGVDLIAAELAAVWGSIDAAEWQARADAYNEELLAVHEEIEALFADVPEQRRQLVTNHDALGYLAHRYDLEIVGTVVPGSSTQAEADARAFAELIETVEATGVDVIFAENTDSTVLADQLASEVIDRGDLEVEVVGIYTDALGEDGSGAETYLGLLRTTAQLIADAVG